MLMGVLKIILIVLETICSVALIGTVLMQSSKEDGLSGSLSGNSNSYLGKNGNDMDKMLATATKWIGVAWVLLTLSLSLF